MTDNLNTIIKEADKQNGLDGRLIAMVERIEHLEDEKKELSADIREVYNEAKSTGYDTKAIRQIVKLRKMNPSEREESEFLLDEYKRLTGM